MKASKSSFLYLACGFTTGFGKKGRCIMVRKVLILTAIVSVFSACFCTEAAQIPVSWDGGGNYNDWDDAENWDPNIVPDNNATNTYAVTINAGTGEVFVGLRQRSTIDQLDCYGEVSLAMGPHDWQNEPVELTLVDPNGLTNHGELEIDEMEIIGNVTNTAGAMLELCDLEIDGNLYNQAGAMIEVEFENDVEGDLQNEGTLIIPHASDLLVDKNIRNAGLIQLFDGECASYEIFDNNSIGVIRGFGVLYADQLLRNKGEITAYGGSLAIACDGPLTNTGVLGNKPLSSLHIKPAEDVNNFRTIEVHAGGGVAFDCNLVNDTNGVIELCGGTLAATSITQTADANFAGFGGITGDVVIDPNGLIELTGPTNIVGDVNIQTGAVLEISDGTTLITGHTTCNNGTIHMKGGRIIPQGDFTNNNCTIIWEPGTYSNVADFNLDGQVNFKDFGEFADTWLWQTGL